MNVADFEAGALLELRFWLQILGDHARFIKNGLVPGEKEEIAQAEQFINAFDKLLAISRNQLDRRGILTLMQSVNPWTDHLRSFKLHLLQRSLTEPIGIHLPPTFLNHMVNEIEEAIRVFAALTREQLPQAGPAIHQHLIWLQDAVGHAASLASGFDMIEKSCIYRSEAFENHFQNLYMKAIELAGYMRTSLPEFPALRRFNQEADAEMLLFMKFLAEVQELTGNKEALSTILPLIPDHMYREECYYLMKLSMAAAGVPRPDCDPAKPRVE